MEKINLLITSAGRRVSLVKAFKNEVNLLKLESKVYCTDLNPALSPACQVSDGFFKVKRVTDDFYISELLEICIQNNIKLIIPTIDTELEILARNKDLFKQNGITALVPGLTFVKKCRDKRLIHDFFDSINLKRAQEFNLSNLKFPCFVKPTDGSRSEGIYLLHSEKELTNEISGNSKNMFLEYFNSVDYTEFTVDIYFTKTSQIKCIIPRERILVRDGEVNTACTRNNGIVNFVKEKFSKVKEAVGCVTLQVFKHNKMEEVIGIEINPRFGGGYPLSYNAGGNFPRWILQEYILGEDIEDYFDQWKDNLLMLRYDQEIILNGYKG